MKTPTLAVVGIGLLGGSVGRAVRLRGLAGRVLGVDARPEHRERALARGLGDEVFADLASLPWASVDVGVFCTPVDESARQVLAVAPLCPRGALLTDVGSTKAAIVREIEAGLRGKAAFVGGHPMAGSDRSGPDHASELLFRDRLVIL